MRNSSSTTLLVTLALVGVATWMTWTLLRGDVSSPVDTHLPTANPLETLELPARDATNQAWIEYLVRQR